MEKLEMKLQTPREDHKEISWNASLTRTFKQLKQTYFPHPIEDWCVALVGPESEGKCGSGCKTDYNQSLFLIPEDTCIDCTRAALVQSMAYEVAADLVDYLDTCPDECPHKTPELCYADECPEEQMDTWCETVSDIEDKILLNVCRTARQQEDWVLLKAIALGHFDDPELAYPPESPLQLVENHQGNVAQTQNNEH